MTNRRWVALVLFLGACSGGGAATDAALPLADDTGRDAGSGAGSIVGTWFTQVTTGPENQTETLMFNADGSMSAAHSQVNSASSADHAGCTEIVIESGTYVDAADHTSVMVTPGSSLRTYVSCTSSADDGSMPYTGTPIFLTAAATLPYTIADNTLTLMAGGSSVVFTRH